MANRAAFEEVNDKFNSERKIVNLKRYVGAPLVLLSGYFSQKYIRKLYSKKLEKPKLEEDKNPFLINSIGLNTIDASYQLSLKFEF